MSDNLVPYHPAPKPIWMRGLWMLFFLAIYNCIYAIIIIVMLFQFFSVLLSGNKNPRVVKFSDSLMAYIQEIMEFLFFKKELKPFPFSDWPKL